MRELSAPLREKNYSTRTLGARAVLCHAFWGFGRNLGPRFCQGFVGLFGAWQGFEEGFGGLGLRVCRVLQACSGLRGI